MCGGCAACGGEFKEALPLLKLGARRAVSVRPGRTPGLFSKGLSPPPLLLPPPLQFLPRVSRPSCCPREGFPLRFLLHFPLRFRGAEDWGSQLFLGNIPSVPETPIQPGGPRPPLLSLPPPTGAYPFRAGLQPRLFPPFFSGGLGPDVSPASPRPRASGEELSPPAPVPRPPAAPNPAPRARRHE